MEYEELVKDFALRTRTNLDYVFQSKISYGRNVFEVTQLVNSLLGIVVLPQQRDFENIPDIPLNELPDTEWPQGILDLSDILVDYRTLIYCMRHSIAHSDFEFHIENKEIHSITFGGSCRRPNSGTDWRLDLNIEDLRQFVNATCDLMLARSGENGQ